MATLPLTVAPSVGVVNAAVSPPATVTLRVALAALPAASCTVSCSTCAPAATPAVFQSKEALVDATLVVNSGVLPPSRRRVNVYGAAGEPLTDMPIVTVPVTIAPSEGLVKAAIGSPVSAGRRLI